MSEFHTNTNRSLFSLTPIKSVLLLDQNIILKVVVKIAICLDGILNQIAVGTVHWVKIHFGQVVVEYDFLKALGSVWAFALRETEKTKEYEQNWSFVKSYFWVSYFHLSRSFMNCYFFLSNHLVQKVYLILSIELYDLIKHNVQTKLLIKSEVKWNFLFTKVFTMSGWILPAKLAQTYLVFEQLVPGPDPLLSFNFLQNS